MFSFFENLIKPFPEEIPTSPPNSLFQFCMYYTRGVWPWILLMSLLVAIIAIVEVLLFGFLGEIVDWLSNADKVNFLKEEGDTLFLIGLVVLFAIPVLTVFAALLSHQTITGNYPMRIRWMAHRYLLRQSYEFYQDEYAGRVAAKVMQTALGIRETIMKLADVVVYICIYIVGALLLVASFDPWMSVPFICWLFLYIGTLRILLPKLHKVAEEQADANSIMTGRVVDSYTNIATVKLFAHAGREEIYAKQGMSVYMKAMYRLLRMTTKLEITVEIINALLLFSVGFTSIWSWLNGNASVGAVAVAIGLVLRMHGLSHWIMWEMSDLFESLGMAHDGMKTLSKEHTVTDLPNSPDLKVPRGAINFENIRFHYGKQTGAIDHLSLNISPGEKVGIVGRSGAGKTTLMNVLLRLFDLEGGRILIDDQDISHVNQDSLRGQISVVTQDTSLLHRTIRENIAYGDQNATEQDIENAIYRANAHDFISNLVDQEGNQGLNSQVGERGVKLSGGQRQRIAIARVFLKNSPILILDEATSALDSEVEAAIQENLLELMKDKTVIAIAHRLSTISALDRLVIIDQGRIIQQGTHHQLMHAEGLYSELWKRQSGGFIV